MKSILLFLLLLLPFLLFSQKPIPEDWGYTHIPFVFEGDTVDIIVLSAGKNHENYKKPLFLFLQGSLPRPLFSYSNSGDLYGSPYPFNPMAHFKDYHFVTIGKPGVPLIAKSEELAKPYYNFVDQETGSFPRKYCQNNHLDYYVRRNKAVIDFLTKKDWIDDSKTVVAGHSEGVVIGFKMAIDKVKMSHLILLNGNLMGRIISEVAFRRKTNPNDSTAAEQVFDSWKELSKMTTYSDDCSNGDSQKATASFSYPFIQHLSDIDIPIYLGYSTKDRSVLLNDYLRYETIRLGKENYHFKAYHGLNHSFAKVKADGQADYEDGRFDEVAANFFNWLKTQK